MCTFCRKACHGEVGAMQHLPMSVWGGQREPDGGLLIDTTMGRMEAIGQTATLCLRPSGLLATPALLTFEKTIQTFYLNFVWHSLRK